MSLRFANNHERFKDTLMGPQQSHSMHKLRSSRPAHPVRQEESRSLAGVTFSPYAQRRSSNGLDNGGAHRSGSAGPTDRERLRNLHPNVARVNASKIVCDNGFLTVQNAKDERTRNPAIRLSPGRHRNAETSDRQYELSKKCNSLVPHQGRRHVHPCSESPAKGHGLRIYSTSGGFQDPGLDMIGASSQKFAEQQKKPSIPEPMVLRKKYIASRRCVNSRCTRDHVDLLAPLTSRENYGSDGVLKLSNKEYQQSELRFLRRHLPPPAMKDPRPEGLRPLRQHTNMTTHHKLGSFEDKEDYNSVSRQRRCGSVDSESGRRRSCSPQARQFDIITLLPNPGAPSNLNLLTDSSPAAARRHNVRLPSPGRGRVSETSRPNILAWD